MFLLLDGLQVFLTDRRQSVALEGPNSTCRPVLSGVSQGSVLGPLLFSTLVNGLPSKLNSECRLFAADVIIYTTA